MKFNTKTKRERIAFAIYFTCARSEKDLKEFCEKNGFTVNDFEKFLDFGIDGFKFEERLDAYGEEYVWGKELYGKDY